MWQNYIYCEWKHMWQKLKNVVKELMATATIFKLPLGDWIEQQIINIGNNTSSSIHMNWLLNFHLNCILAINIISIWNFGDNLIMLNSSLATWYDSKTSHLPPLNSHIIKASHKPNFILLKSNIPTLTVCNVHIWTHAISNLVWKVLKWEKLLCIQINKVQMKVQTIV